ASKLLEWKNLSTSNNIIKLIVPTLSADDATEYPFASFNDGTHIDAILSRFSPVEIQKFMTFLKNKYKNVNNLNKIWKNISGANSNFNSIDSSSITIRSYGWETIKPLPPAPFTFYNYPEGRRDFLEFRINELKKFIDTCAYEVHNYGFNFGVQFGSIYDNIIELRGVHEPTSLLENVDYIITDEVIEYAPNFNFAADYSRTLCRFWESENGKKIRFGTESNWPGYNSHTPQNLIKYWSEQVRTFFQKGASCLFISHWGTEDGPNNIQQSVIGGTLTNYKSWRDSLNKFKSYDLR